MPSETTYRIEPVPGFELVQEEAPNVASKASKFEGRTLSLNERFAIYERGYTIERITHPEPTKFTVHAELSEDLERDAIIAWMETVKTKTNGQKDEL